MNAGNHATDKKWHLFYPEAQGLTFTIRLLRTTELYLKIPEKERLVASKEYFEMYGSLIDEEETSL